MPDENNTPEQNFQSLEEELQEAADAGEEAAPAENLELSKPVLTRKPQKSTPDVKAFGDISVEIIAMLGRAQMPISQFLKLGRGAVIELDRSKYEDVDILANGHLVARGEIVLVDEMIGLNVTDTIKKHK